MHPSAREVVAAAGVDLRGRVALVTGAASGIGVETVRELARAGPWRCLPLSVPALRVLTCVGGVGALVIMAVRDPAASATEEALADLRTTLGAAAAAQQLELVALDLASPASVRRAAASVLSRHPRLHLLINNAGARAIAPTAYARLGIRALTGAVA
jgi:NAD(P)-dependent dehydrogenase (short-subunit alcohol dehydrogenase family)